MNIPVAIYSMFLLLLDTLLLGIQVDLQAFLSMFLLLLDTLLLGVQVNVSSTPGHPASWHIGRS
jgi:hypothetical protein